MATKNINIYIYTYTVSVVTELQFLYNEYLYLIGGKGNMMKVGVSVYCKLLCCPEKNKEKRKLIFPCLG